MNKLVRFVSKMLVVIFVLTSTIFAYPVNTYATGSNKKDSKTDIQGKGTSKNFSLNRDKTEIIVKYKNDNKRASVSNRIKGKQNPRKFEIKKNYKRSRADLVEIDEKDDINEIIAELKKDPNVEYVQPNYKLDIAADPVDARFTEQWALKNIGQEVEGFAGRAGVDINTSGAWELLTQLGQPAEVVIGVLDTGIDINHEDLSGNIYVNPDEIPDNDIDDDNNGYIDDINGWDFVNNDNTLFDSGELELHGTQVAGIIAAEANNMGVIGVSLNVKLLPLKFINGNWGYTCDAIDAIEYAMAKGVKIINCSFGGTEDNFALKDTMVNSGILFICAGGNRAADVSVLPVYPACFDIPNVLSVASIDSMGVLSPYSSYGSKIHVAAPGINILTTTPDNSYGFLSGTSASAPVATGVAGLLKSYLPSLSFTEIAERIKDNTVPCTNLEGKVSTAGRVNAFAALSNTRPERDDYTGPGNDESTVPGGQQGGNEDTWYTLDQLAKIKEKLHYGESGVNPASGNYSFMVNDMSISAPGFQVNISRTYNSRDGKSKPMGQGWTFGFEGKVEGTDVVSVSLPNGGAQRFRLKDGVYVPEDNRSTFVKKSDGTYELITKDQYKYIFGSNKYLTTMIDRNGNELNIQVDSNGKITQITDTVGRVYTVAYNSSGLIETVTDPENRQVRYEYENNRLVRAIDPKGGIMRYSYDSYGYITEIRDHKNKLVQKLVYNHAEGENQHKVSQATDSLGDVVNYVYDMTNKKTTATDMNGRVSTYWFDKAMYTTRIQDPEGKSTYTEYYMYEGTNKYGDIKSTTDRNGNKTSYEVDSNGNVTKITNPDGSFRVFAYDDKNNQIKETNEVGRPTYYQYDTEKINLVKKVIPLDGITEYTGTDDPCFAVTSYVYYNDGESGCTASGLLQSETDPEGNTTIYTYDADGNIKTVSDPETGKVTQYEYNRIGWRTASISPKGNRMEYSYDKNGQLIKTTIISSKNETSRIIYNLLGQKTQEIQPNQYNPANDNLAADTYSDNTAGTRYTYYDTGMLEAITDVLGNVTRYQYDVYGNVTQLTRPNGSIFRYEYDVMDRLGREYFKVSENSAEILQTEYSYAVMGNGKTQKTQTRYLNETDKAVTVSVYDYANRITEQQNPDGSRIRMTYNSDGTLAASTAENGSITYYKYNGLGLLSEQWSPFEVSKGNTYYTYSRTDYNKSGQKIKEIHGIDLVLKDEIPGELTFKEYEYYKNGRLKKITDNEGRKTEYYYDDDGNVIKEEVTLNQSGEKLTSEYTYNYLGKVETKTQHIRAGDLVANPFDSSADTTLTTVFTYDKNGNLETMTTPGQVVTTYSYDVLNRKTGESKPGLDETGSQVNISTFVSYNWEGSLLTSTDANGNTTEYEYDPQGRLSKIKDPLGGVTYYCYDIGGRKTAEVSPANYDSTKSLSEMNRVEYEYDLMGRLKVKKNIYYDNASGKWTTIVSKACSYDNSGNLAKELDALGYESGTGSTVDAKISSGYGTKYSYNLAGINITVTDPVSADRALSFTTRYEYDGLGRMTGQTNANGVTTVCEYDNAGNILSTGIKKTAADPVQQLQSNVYDLAGRLLSQTDGNGNTVFYEYNAFGQVRKTITPGDETISSNTTIYQYDVMGRLARQTDSTGLTGLYSYDNHGRLLTQTQQDAGGELSITTSARYDKNGNTCFSTDGNGNTTGYTYDGLNRLLTTSITVNGVNKTTTYGYDANGNQISVTDWRGNQSLNVYDPMGRLIEKHDPYTLIQRLEYNKNSVQVKSYDALGNVTRYIYDKNNRLIATVGPEGHTTSQSYDDVGNVRTKTDGRNITTTYNYDEFNRLQSVVNAKLETTGYTYDLNGNMLTQTDGNGHITAFEYNAANLLSRKTDHGGKAGSVYIDAKTERYSYYPDGSMKSKTDRNGVRTNYSYDIFGRLLTLAAGSTSISYTYDDNGNQLTVTDSTGTTTRTYDGQNRVLSKDVPVIGLTSYTYDGIEPDGEYSETTTDPKGNITARVFDKAGRLAHVTAGGESTAYTYYANGSQKSVEYGSGAKEEYTYYADGLVRTLMNKKADGTVIDSYSYTYDGARNQTSKTDSKGTTRYIYDSMERLESVTEPNGRVTGYTYDKAGNRLTETVGGVVTTYAYNEQNRLEKTVTSDGGTTTTVYYTYDNNGNMVNKSTETVKPVDPTTTGSFELYRAGTTADSTIVFYKYDVLNQLSEVITDDKTEKYMYNGEGYRVVKNDNGQITNYLYEYDKVILETDSANSQTARNVYGLNLIYRTSNLDNLYYMYNGHADVTTLITADGTITATYYYDAFGTIIEQSGDVDNNITYAGYQYDSETELYYLNARYYDSKIARFLSEDTYMGSAADPLSLNLYSYCVNNPIKYWDPSGHWAQDDEKLSPDVQAVLIQLTSDWEAATTKSERDRIHNLANDYRSGSIKPTEEVDAYSLSCDVEYLLDNKHVSSSVKDSINKTRFGVLAIDSASGSTKTTIVNGINVSIQNNRNEVIQAYSLLEALQESFNSHSSVLRSSKTMSSLGIDTTFEKNILSMSYGGVVGTESLLLSNDIILGNSYVKNTLIAAMANGGVLDTRKIDSLKRSLSSVSSYKQIWQAEKERKIREYTSALLDCIPVVDDVKGVIEGINGKDTVTGYGISPWQRGINLTLGALQLKGFKTLANAWSPIKTIDNVPTSLLDGPSNYHVYKGVNPLTGADDYIGITNDIARRANQHGDRFSQIYEITDTPITKRQARGIEQAMIEANPNFSNKINSISSVNPIYQDATSWGRQWLLERGLIKEVK